MSSLYSKYFFNYEIRSSSFCLHDASPSRRLHIAPCTAHPIHRPSLPRSRWQWPCRSYNGKSDLQDSFCGSREWLNRWGTAPVDHAIGPKKSRDSPLMDPDFGWNNAQVHPSSGGSRDKGCAARQTIFWTDRIKQLEMLWLSKIERNESFKKAFNLLTLQTFASSSL